MNERIDSIDDYSIVDLTHSRTCLSREIFKHLRSSGLNLLKRSERGLSAEGIAAVGAYDVAVGYEFEIGGSEVRMFINSSFNNLSERQQLVAIKLILARAGCLGVRSFAIDNRALDNKLASRAEEFIDSRLSNSPHDEFYISLASFT